jgi:hypothetical protein
MGIEESSNFVLDGMFLRVGEYKSHHHLLIELSLSASFGFYVVK